MLGMSTGTSFWTTLAVATGTGPPPPPPRPPRAGRATLCEGPNARGAVCPPAPGPHGPLFTGLRRPGFTVPARAKPADLTLFANDVQPITVVMLLDRSGSMRANFSLVEKAA